MPEKGDNLFLMKNVFGQKQSLEFLLRNDFEGKAGRVISAVTERHGQPSRPEHRGNTGIFFKKENKYE